MDAREPRQSTDPEGAIPSETDAPPPQDVGNDAKPEEKESPGKEKDSKKKKGAKKKKEESPEIQEAARHFAAAFDGLVKSVLTNPNIVPTLVERTLKMWRALPEAEIEATFTHLKRNEQDILEITDRDGKWVLPAFMAGLRSIRLTRGAYLESLENFATELAHLGPNRVAIVQFRDWLWLDGPDGFEVTLDQSFIEGLETLFEDLEEQKRQLAATRINVVRSLGEDSITVYSNLLDKAAVHDEFQLPLDMFQENIRDGSFNMTQEMEEIILGRCEDSYFWMKSQINLALERKEIQKALSPKQLAVRLVAQLRRFADLRFLDLLADLGKRPEDYAKALHTAIEEEPVGEIIAETMKVDQHSLKLIVNLVMAGGENTARGLMHGLLRRAPEEEDVMRGLKLLASSVIFSKIYRLISVEILGVEGQICLGKMILSSKDPNQMLADFLDHIALDSANYMLEHTPKKLLWEDRAAVVRLLKKPLQQDERRKVVRSLMLHGEQWLPYLGEALLESGGFGWCSATLRGLCIALVKNGHAPTVVVPLVKHRKLSDECLIMALRALEASPTDLKHACAFKVGDFLLTPEFAARLKDGRKKARRIG